MKKVLTLALVLIMGLVIFSGCENMNNPIEPESNSSSNLTQNSLDNCYQGTFIGLNYEIVEINGDGYVVFDGEEVDTDTSVLVNPHLKHYILDLRTVVENNLISFKNEEMQNSYLNKIDVIEKLIDNNNLRAAIIKLNNDLLDKTEKWLLIEDQKELCKMYVTFSMWMLNNPDNELNLPLAVKIIIDTVTEHKMVGEVNFIRQCARLRVINDGVTSLTYEMCNAWTAAIPHPTDE